MKNEAQHQFFRGRPWLGHNHGYSASREQAMVDFKTRFGPTQ
jgi:hypothetical protein